MSEPRYRVPEYRLEDGSIDSRVCVLTPWASREVARRMKSGRSIPLRKVLRDLFGEGGEEA